MLDKVTQTFDFPAVWDDVLTADQRRQVSTFLHQDTDVAGWQFGWRSKGNLDPFAFWHRHFAGSLDFDKTIYDCEPELRKLPLIHDFWRLLAYGPLRGHRLIRCYANGSTYGSDGTVHTDTKLPFTYTTVYYPHESWHPDWGGETVFFTKAKDDIVASIYPRPNRMVTFDGRIQHAARGVSRVCPVLRVTLMFKTDKPDA